MRTYKYNSRSYTLNHAVRLNYFPYLWGCRGVALVPVLIIIFMAPVNVRWNTV